MLNKIAFPVLQSMVDASYLHGRYSTVARLRTCTVGINHPFSFSLLAFWEHDHGPLPPLLKAENVATAAPLKIEHVTSLKKH
jgi:hypothetical protein